MKQCIREYDMQDFEQVSAISHSFYSDKHGSFSLVEQIEGSRIMTKYVTVDAQTGYITGYALLAEQIRPNIKLRLELIVKKGTATKELLHKLYNKVEKDMIEADPYAVETRLFAANMEEINFFEGKGFTENHRMMQQLLQVQTADTQGSIHTEYELRSNKGIIIRTLAEEFVSRPECMKLLEMLVLETNPDFPNELPSHLRRPNTDTSWLHRSDIIPEAFFIAIHQGKYIGYSHLYKGPNSSLIQGHTAVCNDFRNLGIATVLKMKGITYARTSGDDIIYTANRSSNGAMMKVNEKLGWIVYDSEIRMEKIINKQRG